MTDEEKDALFASAVRLVSRGYGFGPRDGDYCELQDESEPDGLVVRGL